mgnify:CR=1 FL=1|jgi:hypothetical protein
MCCQAHLGNYESDNSKHDSAITSLDLLDNLTNSVGTSKTLAAVRGCDDAVGCGNRVGRRSRCSGRDAVRESAIADGWADVACGRGCGAAGAIVGSVSAEGARGMGSGKDDAGGGRIDRNCW